MSALRGFDRVGCAQPAVKGGHPERKIVVDGRGEMKTPRTGSMEIEAIRRAFDHEQPALFSSERVGLEGLQETQGISRPQGLDSIGDPEWEDDEAGAKFFDYLLGRA